MASGLPFGAEALGQSTAPSYGTPAATPRPFYVDDFASAADAVQSLTSLNATRASGGQFGLDMATSAQHAMRGLPVQPPFEWHATPAQQPGPMLSAGMAPTQFGAPTAAYGTSPTLYAGTPPVSYSMSSHTTPITSPVSAAMPQLPSQQPISSARASALPPSLDPIIALSQELGVQDDLWSPVPSSSDAGLSPADLSSSSTPSPGHSSTSSGAPPAKRARSTSGSMRLQLHVRGFKQVLPLTLDCSTSISEARARILEAQAAHPRAIHPDEYDRVVLLTKKPSTMNTTCKYELEDTIQDLSDSILGDYAHVSAVYIYLACPEAPLSNEDGVHRRLAKRDVGVCEAHREKLGRSRKTGKKVALVVPGIRARVVANAGTNVGVKDAKHIQKLWMEQVPNFLKSFLEEHGLQLQQVRFTNSQQGSVILDMELVFECSNPLAPCEDVTPAQVLGLQRKFAIWLQAKCAGAAPFTALAPLEIDYIRMDVDALEPQLDVSPLDPARVDAGLAGVYTVIDSVFAEEVEHADAICAVESRMARAQHAERIASSQPLSGREQRILRKSLDLISGGFSVPRSDEGVLSLYTALDVQRCAIARLMTEACSAKGIEQAFYYNDISIGLVEGAFITDQLQRLPRATCGKVTGSEQTLSVQLHSPLFRDAEGHHMRLSVWPTELRVDEANALFEPCMGFVRMQQQQLAQLANSLLVHFGIAHKVAPNEVSLYAVYEDAFDYDKELRILTSGRNPQAPAYEPPTKSDLEELVERLPESDAYGILFAQPSATARQRLVSLEFRQP